VTRKLGKTGEKRDRHTHIFKKRAHQTDKEQAKEKPDDLGRAKTITMSRKLGREKSEMVYPSA